MYLVQGRIPFGDTSFLLTTMAIWLVFVELFLSFKGNSKVYSQPHVLPDSTLVVDIVEQSIRAYKKSVDLLHKDYRIDKIVTHGNTEMMDYMPVIIVCILVFGIFVKIHRIKYHPF